MTEYYYDTFNCKTHSEDIYNLDPDELAEVQILMADDDPEWDGYEDWSAELEEAERWNGAIPVETPNGQILIKPECDRRGTHRDCTIYRCSKAARLGGIDV